jgi:hypothetical protein
MSHGSVPLVVSAVIPPGFRHGFTTRAGGVSAAPFDSLNMGGKWGDTRDNVAENRRRVLATAGTASLFVATQVHGNAVCRVRDGDDPVAVAAQQADAVVTDLPDVVVAVFVADCVPLVMADVRTGACAAVHAGWRGVVGGIAGATLGALAAEFGTAPGDVRVAMGPCIGVCCFEVGPEVVARFEATFPGARSAGIVIDGASQERPHVDLRRALRTQLEAAGVPPGFIGAETACTRCDAAGRFFSYRRDAGRTGQHIGFICRAGPGQLPGGQVA